MLRTILALVIGLGALSLVAYAADETKKLEGNLVCTKCTLGETAKCGHALKVKEGDKEVVYYIDDKGGKEAYHKGVCPANSEKKATVTGVIVEKEGKKHVTKPKVEVAK